MQQIIQRVIATLAIKQAGVKRYQADSGAVTHIQRFGSAANLNIHLQGERAEVECHPLSGGGSGLAVLLPALQAQFPIARNIGRRSS